MTIIKILLDSIHFESNLIKKLYLIMKVILFLIIYNRICIKYQYFISIANAFISIFLSMFNDYTSTYPIS